MLGFFGTRLIQSGWSSGAPLLDVGTSLGSSCPRTLFGKSIGRNGGILLGSRRAISGESISSLQVFPKVRGTRGEKVEDYFCDDDGCEYSPFCLQCPLPVCKYDGPVGSKNGGSKIWVLSKLNRGPGVAAN